MGKMRPWEAVREDVTTHSVSSGAVTGSPKPGNNEKVMILLKVPTLIGTFPALRKFGTYWLF